MTFQLIDQERAHHAVSRLCSVLNVSRQGYWAWKHRPVSRRRREDERLKPRILKAWSDPTGPTARHGCTPSCGSATASLSAGSASLG